MITLTVTFKGRSLQAAYDLADLLEAQSFRTQIPDRAQCRVVARKELQEIPSAAHLVSQLTALNACYKAESIMLCENNARLDIKSVNFESDRFIMCLGSNAIQGWLYLSTKNSIHPDDFSVMVDAAKDRLALFLALVTVGRYAGQGLGRLKERDLDGAERKFETILRYCARIIEGAPLVQENRHPGAGL